MKISYFKSAKTTTPNKEIEFNSYLDDIRNGFWQDIVLNYRTGKINDKATIPAVTASGTFSKRENKGLVKHSNFINIDIDKKDNTELDLLSFRAELYTDDYVYAGHLSVSGKGLTCYIKINHRKHLDSFLAIEKYFANEYHVIIDTKTKDVSRLRFVSYDPDLYINKTSKKWDKFIPKEKKQPLQFNNYISSQNDFDFVMNQITSRNIDITSDYYDWLKVGFSIASEFKESGRSYFHDISRIYPNYNSDKTDKKYNNILKHRSRSTIGTFYYLAKQSGCDIKTTRTKKIEKVARLRFKSVGKNGGLKTKEDAFISTKEYLNINEGITGKDVDLVIKKVSELTNTELKEKETSLIDVIIQYINIHKLEYNEITGKLESNGKPMNDRSLNNMYVDINQVESKVSKNFFDIVINSDRIETKNPFLKFIEKNRHLKPKGNIKRAIDVLSDNMKIDNKQINDYKEVYVRKWLISIIASFHGTYSLMILVLTGKQGINKTNWFRFLLPDELRGYYAESKLDAGKDDEILMTQKLVLIDDEFGGKSKMEAKKLKDLSSKQYFSIRRPYGRVSEDLMRIAVLGGTSNDDEIINDPTGNRRIIPLKIDNINIDEFKKIDKTELFMELYNEWKAIGDGWMLTPDEVAMLNKSTVMHEQSVLELDLINKYFSSDINYHSELTSTDIKVILENKSNQKLSLYKISHNLKKAGYKQKVKSINGKSSRIWDIYEHITASTINNEQPSENRIEDLPF